MFSMNLLNYLLLWVHWRR